MHWNGGQRLKQARENAGLTIDEIAEKTKVSKRTIINYEGNKTIPTISFLIAVAKFCTVSFTWLAIGEVGIKSIVTEPKESYGFGRQEIDLIKQLFEVPEARPLIYKYISENIKTSEMAAELDKILLETFSKDKEN